MNKRFPRAIQRALSISLLLTLLLPLHVFSSEITDSAQIFTDVKEDNYYEEAIIYMNEMGFVSGYSDGSFGVENTVTRVEALKMILEAAEIELHDVNEVLTDSSENAEDESASNGIPLLVSDFSDLNSDDWYATYVQTALNLGIAKGYDDLSFRPSEAVSRVELLKMWYEASNRFSPTYTENYEGEHWYSIYFDYAIEDALIIPDENYDFVPAQVVTRGELCDILFRDEFGIYQAHSTEYGEASYYGYSWDGANTSSGKPLEVYGHQAAHQTLPFGTWVRVVNRHNGYVTEVEIVDRGPFVEGRIIDLTPAAFEEIGVLSRGLYDVYIEVIER
jgi:hypothetical protein